MTTKEISTSINTELDDLAVLLEYWTRNRERGRTPLTVRKTILFMIKDLSHQPLEPIIHEDLTPEMLEAVRNLPMIDRNESTIFITCVKSYLEHKQ
jgi:hypothetical protein